MPGYKSKQELLDEISNSARLFINEFSDIQEADKDKLLDGVDRTPAQMIAYQLGWLNLILDWEEQEQRGITVFEKAEQKIIELTESYTDTELFQSGGRKWASSTPANWAIWKWIHTNTVAPFKSFRSKIRKWKGVIQDNVQDLVNEVPYEKEK